MLLPARIHKWIVYQIDLPVDEISIRRSGGLFVIHGNVELELNLKLKFPGSGCCPGGRTTEAEQAVARAAAIMGMENFIALIDRVSNS